MTKKTKFMTLTLIVVLFGYILHIVKALGEAFGEILTTETED